jgi:hypothetical protein
MMKCLPAAFAALCFTAPLLAQAETLAPGDVMTERVAGFSWYSPAAASLGSVANRRVYLTGVRKEAVFAASGPFALAYTVELVPLAVVERTGANTQRCRRNPNLVTFTCQYDYSARVAVGAGATPLGLKWYFNRGGLTRVYAAAGAGGLVFTSHVPVHRSRRANFTFEYGGGIEVLERNGAGLTVGYKFHHISNGGTTRLNPGLDANVLYLGVVSRRPRPSS